MISIVIYLGILFGVVGLISLVVPTLRSKNIFYYVIKAFATTSMLAIMMLWTTFFKWSPWYSEGESAEGNFLLIMSLVLFVALLGVVQLFCVKSARIPLLRILALWIPVASLLIHTLSGGRMPLSFIVSSHLMALIFYVVPFGGRLRGSNT